VAIVIVLVDMVVGWIGFRAAAPKAPAWLWTWLGQPSLTPQMLDYVGMVGAFCGLLYSITVLWPAAKRINWIGTPYVLLAVPLAWTAFLGLMQSSTAAALLTLCPAMLIWLTLAGRDYRHVADHVLLGKVEGAAQAVMKACIVAAIVYPIGQLIPSLGPFEFLRYVLLIPLGILGVLFLGLVIRLDRGTGDKAVVDPQWLLDSLAIGTVVGVAAAVYPYRWTPFSALLVGVVAGFFIGVFLGGFNALLSGVFVWTVESMERLRKLIDRLRERFSETLPKRGTGFDNAMRSLSALGTKLWPPFGLAARAIAIFGIVMGLLLALFIKFEPFSYMSYRQTAHFPEGCPPACTSKTFHVPMSLFGESLRRANLDAANLSGSLCFNVDFREASLVKADLSNSMLWGSTFDGANLEHSTLAGTMLIRGSFVGANLTDADLSGTFLDGADLRTDRIKGLRVTYAHYDEKTRWPDGFDPAGAGALMGPLRRIVPPPPPRSPQQAPPPQQSPPRPTRPRPTQPKQAP
jgi:hypothetical protein